MSLSDLFELVKVWLSGRTDLSTVLETPSALLLVFVFALLGILPVLLKTGHRRQAGAAFGLAGLLAIAFYLTLPPKDPGRGPGESFTLHAGQVLIGGDLQGAAERGGKNSLEACQERCLRNSKCLAFTFDNVEQTCFLKRDALQLHSFPSAVTGIRRVAASQSTTRR